MLGRPFQEVASSNFVRVLYKQPTNHDAGRYGCIGKALAKKNLTYVTAILISKYDVELAPGEDGSRFWADMKDDFTAVPGRLDLVFKLRKTAE